jgi:hypothetical protein
LFKLPVNSSAAVNSLENYGPVNSLSVKNVKQFHFEAVLTWGRFDRGRFDLGADLTGNLSDYRTLRLLGLRTIGLYYTSVYTWRQLFKKKKLYID